jgi:hypothetical protein
MARPTPEQRAAARVDFEVGGMSQTAIARKYGVSRGAVSQWAAAEGWQAGKTKQIQEKKVNAVMALVEAEAETKQANLNSLERAVLDGLIADEVAFRTQSDARMEATALVAMRMLEAADKVSDVKMVMETLRIQREARLGKAPDTAIQINNGEVASGIDRLHARRIGGRDA